MLKTIMEAIRINKWIGWWKLSFTRIMTINLVNGFPWAMESWSFKKFLVTLQILKGSLWGEMLTPNLATLETFLLSQIHFSFSVWVMSRTTHVQESWWSPNYCLGIPEQILGIFQRLMPTVLDASCWFYTDHQNKNYL